ncbi:MAG: transketolase [Deltaproteobacteria bacterium]|nr:transketolase [Deltaproteobacteria bacterium]
MTMRTLAIDAIQKANSGHPGAPMALAPVLFAIAERLRFDPSDANWDDRDRFVLSAGHASSLLYAFLHLARVKKPDGSAAVTLDDLKRFRQLHSITAGHPERGMVVGVETTTGPLGQGAGTSVGMAIAARFKAARYNQPGLSLFSHKVYSILGDGCMMEGVSSEAASLAGHLKLGNLCWLYDSNNITIDGGTELAFTEDTGARFAAYGWHVERVADANDLDAVGRALDAFGERSAQPGAPPTLIIVKSRIGFGSPKKEGTRHAHGEPLGPDEVKATKKAYGWPEDAEFRVPDEAHVAFDEAMATRSAAARATWRGLVERYAKEQPALYAELTSMWKGELPAGWDAEVPVFPADPKGVASRDAGGKVLNAIAKRVPWMIGGAADLAPSTKTTLTFEGAGVFQASSPGGRNFHFGVREHGMTAVLNGMALSGLRPFGAGFLVFADYARGSLRLSSLMKLPVAHVFTHDSIGVGEDGPTHQPIEHLASLRAMPGMLVLRPADANETAEAWKLMLRTTNRPAALCLTRQNLATVDRAVAGAATGVAKGGYVLFDAPDGKPAVLLIATGSEVGLCVDARAKLAAEGIHARVVSLPSWELFAEQDAAYRESVIPSSVTARVCVEMASALGWERFAGPSGAILAMHAFGESAPWQEVAKHFGFTVDNVARLAKAQLGRA